MLTDGWRLADARGGARETEAGAFDDRLAMEGVRDADNVAAVLELRVVDGVAGADDGVGGDAPCLQGRFALGGKCVLTVQAEIAASSSSCEARRPASVARAGIAG